MNPFYGIVNQMNIFLILMKCKVPPEKHLQHRVEYQKGERLEKGVGLTDAWIDILHYHIIH